MRWFGMNNIQEIERMTQYEYELRMTAFQLKRLDRERDIHWQAWENNQVKAEKNVGTKTNPKTVPVFTTFKDFFDYEKLENQIKGIDTDEVKFKDDNLKALLKKANS